MAAGFEQERLRVGATTSLSSPGYGRGWLLELKKGISRE